jgi:cysteine desulfurase
MKSYLDNASTTPMDFSVIEEMVLGMKNFSGNPSSTHSDGRMAKAEIEKAKNSIASLLFGKSSQFIFTSGGTESNNLVLYSCLIFGDIKTVITSKIEHPAVYSTLIHLQKIRFFSILYVDLKENGDIDLDDLEQKLAQSSDVLVSLMHGNNEIGNILDLEIVGNLCKKHNALFHSDTVQTVGFYPFELENSPVDFITCSAHKIHGPKGIGFVYIKNKKNIRPMILGGGQQMGIRSGTENLHSIIGLKKSLEIAYTELEKNKKQITELKQYTIERLKNSFPKAHLNGNCLDKTSLYKLISVSLPFKNDLLGFQLDLKGISVSQGSACSSGASKFSSVLSELSISNENHSPLRISFSKFNTKAEVDYLIQSLIEISK